MLRVTRQVLLVCSLAVAAPAAGQPTYDYQCTITRVASADEETGALLDDMKKAYVGQQFTVERFSGVMAGTLKNAYVTRPRVIDEGSAQNAYKVVTTMTQTEARGPGSSISALTVMEYRPGPRKPFVFLRDWEVYFGYCQRFGSSRE